MNNAVGCFGSVLYHDAKSRRCNACEFMGKCAEEVQTNKDKLETLMKTLATTDRSSAKARKKAIKSLSSGTTLIKPVSKVTHSAAKTYDADLAHLNVKVREFIQRWIDKGIDFKAYRDGATNPFASCGNKFALVAMQFLMEKGSCSKLEMTDYLIDNAGARGPWGSGTACSHAGIVFEAFEHLGIISVVEGKAHLVR